MASGADFNVTLHVFLRIHVPSEARWHVLLRIIQASRLHLNVFSRINIASWARFSVFSRVILASRAYFNVFSRMILASSGEFQPPGLTLALQGAPQGSPKGLWWPNGSQMASGGSF